MRAKRRRLSPWRMAVAYAVMVVAAHHLEPIFSTWVVTPLLVLLGWAVGSSGALSRPTSRTNEDDREWSSQ